MSKIRQNSGKTDSEKNKKKPTVNNIKNKKGAAYRIGRGF